jgi:hypothetical protein
MKLSGEAEPRWSPHPVIEIGHCGLRHRSIPLTSILSHPGEEAYQDTSSHFLKRQD